MNELARPIGSGNRPQTYLGRKQSVTEIFHNAIVLLGKNASAIATILLVPAFFLTLRCLLHWLYSAGPEDTTLWQLINIAGGSCDNILATSALATLLYFRSIGEEMSVGQALKRSVVRFLPTLLYCLGLGIGLGVSGIFLIFPAIFVQCVYGLTTIVAPLEPNENAFERSAELTKRRLKLSFLFLVVVPLTGLALLVPCVWGAAVISTAASVSMTGQAMHPALMPINAWLGGLIGLAWIPINTALLVLFYSDCQAVLAERDGA